MVDAATDADLTFNAANNLLHTPKIDAAGLSPDGTNFGVSGYVPLADGAGGWSWANLQGASAVNTILNGFTVSEEGNVVGTAGSITQLDFRGVNVLASADPAPNGIATVSILLNQSLDSLDVSGIATFRGPVSNGSTTGNAGQYLQSTGIGVTWASFPTLRVVGVNTATAGQTAFNFSYNVDFLDVFVNGVKLTPSEYTATNGNQIVLNTPAFADEIVEFHSYNITSNYGGGGGGGGGASNLNGLSDVTIGTLADGQLLQYNSSSGEWENISAATVVGAASSFATKVATATTATAGQTTFNGTYTVGFVDVFLNGVKQSEDQYTATTGTNIVFTQGASEDDLIEVVGLTANVPGSGGGGGSSYADSNVDAHLNVSGATSGQILSWNGSDYAWVTDQTGGGSSYTNSDVDSHINVSGATSGQILSWNGSDYAWVTDQSGGGSIAGISTTGTSFFNVIDTPLPEHAIAVIGAGGTISHLPNFTYENGTLSVQNTGSSGSGDLNVAGEVSSSTLSVSGNTTLTGNAEVSTGRFNIGVQGGYAATITNAGVATFSGSVTASSFIGDGSQLTGIVTSIVAGTNVTVSNTGGTYTINSSGGGGASGPDPVMMGMIF
jgi:hypothetical protein